MKVQAISAFVVGVLLCAAVVMMRELGTKRSPAAADSSDVPSAGGSQGLQQAPKLEPNQDAAGAHEVNAALVARLETLELAVKRLHPVRELDELRVRIAELERSMQNGQPAMTNPEPRSQASEIAVLKREIASLDRAQTQLASKVASAQNQSAPDRNDLRVLQQKVFSLETTVQRLESRR